MSESVAGLVSRAVKLNALEVAAFRHAQAVKASTMPEELRSWTERPATEMPEEVFWQRSEFLTRCYAEADKRTGYSAAMGQELCDLVDAIEETPSKSLFDLLAKLRWLVLRMSDETDPEVPTLEGAYSWSGEDRTQTMVARIWADAERLIGGAS